MSGGMAGEDLDNAGKRGQRFGRYQIVAHIASGGMGAVYKAFDTDEKKVVALKVMSPELAAKPNMIARFRREARSASKLGHENIVAVHDFGEAHGTFYLALEFVDGKDLHEYIARSPGKHLAPEEARQIALQAARALDHIHRASVIHRDIKPANFLVVKRPDFPLVKLTDLGLARFEDDDEHRVTKAGTTLGTVDYMAPEQARDSGKADIRSDIYALGCTLFHMLAGRPPFNKGSMAERIVQHIETEPPDISKLNESVPKGLALILRKMLAKKPRDRYQTPAELVADLENPNRLLQPPEARPADKKPRKPADGASKPSSVELPAKKKTRKSQAKTPAWVPFAIGGGIVALLGFIVLIIVMNREGRPQEKKQAEVKAPEKRIEAPKPVAVQQLVGPPAPALKPLYKPVLPLDVTALAQEFYGPFTTFPDPPADAQLIVVSRVAVPGVASVRSLAEAFAQAPGQGGAAVIEIRDQGPHFLAGLPAQSNRNLWIRGGAGVRPLLAWDIGDKTELVALVKGNLTLDDLDIVVHGTDTNAPLCLFHVQQGDFQARSCTFSVSGKHSQGVMIARLQGAGPAAAASLVAFQDTATSEAKARFTRCYARGQDVILVSTHNTAAEILIDGTLAVGGTQPLVLHSNLEEDSLTVRLVRSTLIAQHGLWRWQGSAGRGAAPRLRGFAWDTLLARADAIAPDADLLHLADGARANLMSFRAVNCLYTGWKNLLVSSDRVCSTLDAWRDLWGHREGDLAHSESWLPRGATVLDELPAALLYPDDTPAGFAATARNGPLGCDIGRLPADPPHWKQRTFERWSAAIVDFPETETPEIPSEPAGLYHGEKIELGKLDLGLHVQARLQTMKPGPRVVLHLSGKGTQVTSPLRFKGVEQVVIYFEQVPTAGKESLTLELKPGGGSALIDVEGGSLEVHHGRLRFDNSRIAAMPPYMIRVRQGDLRLQRCTLFGPLSKAPDTFQSLIACEGAGVGAAEPTIIALRDCVLQSGKAVLEVKNPGARLRVRGCLLYSLGDVVTLDLGVLPTSRPEIVALFEHNTVGLRQAFVNLRCFEAPAHCQPVVLQANSNYLVDPFLEEPRQGSLVRLSAESLARGLLLWQGKGNVFARDRLQAYYALGEGAVPKQSLKDWEQLLGPVGETDSIHVDAPPKAFNADQPAYDRLALPPTLRRDPMPGADLGKLGVGKKKG
jgi:serine/threonine protein kinase